jgi:sugar phosphate isomerase/epimerase
MSGVVAAAEPAEHEALSLRYAALGPSIGPTASPGGLDAMLTRAARLGATGVQLSATDWDVVIGGRLMPRRLRRFRSIVERHALEYTLHAPVEELDLIDADLDFQRAHFCAWLEVAGALGCRTMTYHPGRYDAQRHHHRGPEALLLREREALARLADTAAGFGVTIACENLYDEPWWPAGTTYFSAQAHWLLALVEAVGHPHLAVCLDLGHLHLATRGSLPDFVDAVRRLAPHAAVLHVHDNLGRPVWRADNGDALSPAAYSRQLLLGEGDLHLPLRWGNVPLEAAFAAADLRRRPICVLEIHPRHWCDDPGPAIESMAIATRLLGVASSSGVVR